jgi:hypothetical protein
LPGAASQTLGAPETTAPLQVDHARERLIVDLDQLGGIACLLERLSDAERHSIADVPNLALCEEGANRSKGFWTSRIFRHEERWQAAETAAGNIVAGENTQHAR